MDYNKSLVRQLFVFHRNEYKKCPSYLLTEFPSRSSNMKWSRPRFLCYTATSGALQTLHNHQKWLVTTLCLETVSFWMYLVLVPFWERSDQRNLLWLLSRISKGCVLKVYRMLWVPKEHENYLWLYERRRKVNVGKTELVYTTESFSFGDSLYNALHVETK